MRNRIYFTVACVFLGLTTLASYPGGARTSPELARFDEECAQCRRAVRRYCAVVQEMMKDPKMDENKQLKGISLLQEARQQWKKVMSEWGDTPPPEYASDGAFKARLQDFANAMEDMENALAAGNPRRSFMACSFGCGLFVTLHEQNGLAYALDTLFHLRKSVKTAEAVMKVQGINNVRPLLPEILQKRDQVLIAPAPWREGDERLLPYYDSVRQLSRQMDEFTLALETNDFPAAREALKELLSQINQAYGLSL